VCEFKFQALWKKEGGVPEGSQIKKRSRLPWKERRGIHERGDASQPANDFGALRRRGAKAVRLFPAFLALRTHA
jgi:hypothetical protein